MKILLQNSGFSRGLVKVLEALGQEFAFWDGEEPIFDFLNKYVNFDLAVFNYHENLALLKWAQTHKSGPIFLNNLSREYTDLGEAWVSAGVRFLNLGYAADIYAIGDKPIVKTIEKTLCLNDKALMDLSNVPSNVVIIGDKPCKLINYLGRVNEATKILLLRNAVGYYHAEDGPTQNLMNAVACKCKVVNFPYDLKHVLAKETYFDRAIALFSAFGNKSLIEAAVKLKESEFNGRFKHYYQ